jgi:hypothetical protein
MKKMKTISSTDYKAVFAESFDILIDPAPRYPAKPVIGLKVDAEEGSFIMPIEYGAAKAVADCILRTLLSVAPELFY